MWVMVGRWADSGLAVCFMLYVVAGVVELLVALPGKVCMVLFEPARRLMGDCDGVLLC